MAENKKKIHPPTPERRKRKNSDGMASADFADKLKRLHIFYYALLREERGASTEIVETSAQSAQDLYEELKKKYHFKLSTDILKVAINNEFTAWDTVLKSGDKIIFIPPVAGG